MSHNGLIGEYKANDVIYYEGKSYRFVSSSNDYVVVEDSQGNQKYIKSEELQSRPVWNYNPIDPEVVERYDRRIEDCKNELGFLKSLVKAAKESVSTLYSEFDARFKFQLNSEQLAEVKVAEKDLNTAVSKKIAKSNELTSTQIGKFIYVT